VHDAVMRAFRAFEGTHIANPKAWLLTVVRNCHLSKQKRLRPELSISDLSEETLGTLAAAPLTPEEENLRLEGQRTFESLLGALPFAQREILVMRELEELSYSEIAAVTGVPMGTVMSRIARARSALKDLWMQQQPEVGHGVP